MSKQKKEMPGIKKILEQQRKEYQRYLGVLAENFTSQVKLIVEQYSNINQNLTLHTEMIGSIKEDVEIIKTDVEFLKGALKKKVDYDEFAALERRMTLVESKIRR